jgi:hypothetical protein
MSDKREWVKLGDGKKAHCLSVSGLWTLCAMSDPNMTSGGSAPKCKKCVRELAVIESGREARNV